jgi:hypothetical protein
MNVILRKIAVFLSGILALLGVSGPSIQAPPQKQAAEVRQTTPLYLKLGVDIFPKVDSQLLNINLVQHWSHGSHVSHHSHHSHHSHFSSR